jgi:hypothetical protein
MPYVWIDPPEGYIYGFPRVVHVDHLDDSTDWDNVLIQNGYPANKKDTLPMRMWMATDEDVVNESITSLHRSR